jgi:hypothetical protein
MFNLAASFYLLDVSKPGHLHNITTRPPYTFQINPSIADLTYTNGKTASLDGLSFFGRRPHDTLFTYSLNMDYSPTRVSEEAGVTVSLQQSAHLEMGVVLLEADTPYLRVKRVSTAAVPDYQTPLPSA